MRPTRPQLTEVFDAVARLVQRPRVELESDDGKDEDSKHDEQADLHERRQRLEDRLQNDLQACGRREERGCKSLGSNTFLARKMKIPKTKIPKIPKMKIPKIPKNPDFINGILTT